MQHPKSYTFVEQRHSFAVSTVAIYVCSGNIVIVRDAKRPSLKLGMITQSTKKISINMTFDLQNVMSSFLSFLKLLNKLYLIRSINLAYSGSNR